MRCSFSAACIPLTFLPIAIMISAATEVEPGYDCDNTFISESRLNEIVGEVKREFWLGLFSRGSKRLTNFYHGPPFNRQYLLWPVSPKTKDYDEAALSPFNAVLDKNKFQVFSVIMKNGVKVKECRLREKLTMESKTNHFNCKPGYVYHNDLKLAASRACPKIHDFATAPYPARYHGPPIENSGRQLYFSPAHPDMAYDILRDPRKYYVVINSDCKIVGVVKRSKDLKIRYKHCKAMDMIDPPSSPPHPSI